MTNNPSSIRVILAPRFQKDVKQLKKKYPHIGTDLKPITDALTDGELPGDKVQGVGYDVWKARAGNSDAGRGKSGGYRLIYYIKLIDHIVVLTVYSKSDRSDITAEEIRRVIEEYNNSLAS